MNISSSTISDLIGNKVISGHKPPKLDASAQPTHIHEQLVSDMFLHYRERILDQVSIIATSMNLDVESASNLYSFMWGCKEWGGLSRFISNLELAQKVYATLNTGTPNIVNTRHVDEILRKLALIGNINPYDVSEVHYERMLHESFEPDITVIRPYGVYKEFARKLRAGSGIELFHQTIQKVALRTSRVAEGSPLSSDFISALRQMHRFWKSNEEKLDDYPLVKNFKGDCFAFMISNMYGIKHEIVSEVLKTDYCSCLNINQNTSFKDTDIVPDRTVKTMSLGTLKAELHSIRPELIGDVIQVTGAPSIGVCLGHLPDDAILSCIVLEDKYLPSLDIGGALCLYVLAISIKDASSLAALAACSAKHVSFVKFNKYLHGQHDIDFPGDNYEDGYTFAWNQLPGNW